MAHWLTTHYPHPLGHPWFVYLKDKFRSRGDRISPGDEIFFYELAGKSKRGRRGIVMIGRVTEGMRENREHRTPGSDESPGVWEWEIPCGHHDETGRVAKDDMYAELGWPPNRPLQIAGGIVSLPPSVADCLRARFKGRNVE